MLKNRLTGAAPGPSPLFLSVADLLEAYQRGDLSPSKVTAEALDRIERFDPQLNAFLHVDRDEAMRQARAAEVAFWRGRSRQLEGVPMAIKDTFPLRGTPTTYGSLLYAGSVSPRDCQLVGRLRAAGAIFVGKTNMSEFGQSGTTENRLRDPCRNPWDLSRTSGGSSGGTAAAVAAGMATVGLGSDGGGSIRIPAAFCGLFGLKPSINRLPNRGPKKAFTYFASPGPIGRTVDDARRVYEVLAGEPMGRRELRGVRIAWCQRPEGHPVQPEVLAMLKTTIGKLVAAGFKIEEATPPIAGWNEAFGVLVLADEYRQRGRLLSSDAERLTRYELRTLQEARKLTRQQVLRARHALEQYRRRFADFFLDHDLLITPTTAVTAFPVGHRPKFIDGRAVGRLWGAFPFTAPFNVAGLPAATVPIGCVGGLPVGLQVITGANQECLLLDFAEVVERVSEFDVSALIERYPTARGERQGSAPPTRRARAAAGAGRRRAAGS